MDVGSGGNEDEMDVDAKGEIDPEEVSKGAAKGKGVGKNSFKRKRKSSAPVIHDEDSELDGDKNDDEHKKRDPDYIQEEELPKKNLTKKEKREIELDNWAHPSVQEGVDLSHNQLIRLRRTAKNATIKVNHVQCLRCNETKQICHEVKTTRRNTACLKCKVSKGEKCSITVQEKSGKLIPPSIEPDSEPSSPCASMPNLHPATSTGEESQPASAIHLNSTETSSEFTFACLPSGHHDPKGGSKVKRNPSGVQESKPPADWEIRMTRLELQFQDQGVQLDEMKSNIEEQAQKQISLRNYVRQEVAVVKEQFTECSSMLTRWDPTFTRLGNILQQANPVLPILMNPTGMEYGYGGNGFGNREGIKPNNGEQNRSVNLQDPFDAFIDVSYDPQGKSLRFQWYDRSPNLILTVRPFYGTGGPQYQSKPTLPPFDMLCQPPGSNEPMSQYNFDDPSRSPPTSQEIRLQAKFIRPSHMHLSTPYSQPEEYEATPIPIPADSSTSTLNNQVGTAPANPPSTEPGIS
ncbi:hypothetical protein CPB83DRAFT_841224 [Crepidotus variabilis]|uniref:Uncharacterized protein n=1 Tax=Crepidotus variabilis TaxID=179855 RepID=A0A9P6BBJ2_9AGAR|nr:hypothetical protein CPB83DRAFT_841224 [Crepidotus variabilis]